MRRIVPLFPILFVLIAKESKADCNPAFTFNVQGATVSVQASNTAPNLRHEWRFPSWLYGTTATYTYNVPGTYYLVHVVTDSLTGCADSARQLVTVTFPVNCAVSFTATRDSFQLRKYNFHSTSTNTGGSIFYYSWEMDDSPIGYGANLTYTLPVGTHNICLTIITTANCTSSSCQAITILSTDTCNWAASFTTVASPSNPRQVTFNPTPSLDRMRFNWNFGDSYTSSQKTPVHNYAHAGNYNVRLAIIDTLIGCLDTIVQPLEVHGLPSDSCTVYYIYRIDSTHPGNVIFTAYSNQTITSQTWWINQWSNPYDSIFIHTNNPTYTFTDTGYYQACLYITTVTGCTRSYCQGFYLNNVGGNAGNRVPSYPNPARNSVSFRVNLPVADRIGVTVYNLSGYAVYKTQKQGTTGTNEVTIPVQQLNVGQYLIDITYGDQLKRSIFQKL